MQNLDDDSIARLLLIVHQYLLAARNEQHRQAALVPFQVLLEVLEGRILAFATFRYTTQILLQMLQYRCKHPSHAHAWRVPLGSCCWRASTLACLEHVPCKMDHGVDACRNCAGRLSTAAVQGHAGSLLQDDGRASGEGLCCPRRS